MATVTGAPQETFRRKNILYFGVVEIGDRGLVQIPEAGVDLHAPEIAHGLVVDFVIVEPVHRPQAEVDEDVEHAAGRSRFPGSRK